MFRYALFFLTTLYFVEVDSKHLAAGFAERNGRSHENRFKRQVIVFDDDNQEQYKWPNKTVHYFFDKREFDDNVKDAVLHAMELISNHTCIKFSTEPSDVVIQMKSENKDYCYSVIGHRKETEEGTQRFSFNSLCHSSGLAAHELIHSLGFMHAHQRSDRDQYLNFIMDLDGMTLQNRQQYEIHENQKLYVPYDYGSVMQYRGSYNTYYPIRKNLDMMSSMGSEIVAFYDYLMINKYYECSCENSEALKCQNFGYPNPSNCSQCNCPLGYGGVDCSQRPEPGATLAATSEWQKTTITLDAGYREETDGRRAQIDYIYHYLWITAPANKHLQFRIAEFNEKKCVQACVKGGIEIKTNDDPRLTSPRLCCESEKNIVSKQNPTVLIAFNAEGVDEYTISYRYI